MSMPRAQAEASALETARLRRQMTAGTIEPWTGPLPDGLDTRPLHHLPPPPVPPSREPGLDDPRLELWRTAFRPGLCYYRLGPGFIQVKDIRAPESAARIIISQKPLIDAFLRCERPVLLADQDGDDRAALEVLLQEGLLLQFGELVTTAPYHMRCWPIPAVFA
jgi:hypothetical protein